MKGSWWVRQTQLNDEQKGILTLDETKDHLVLGPAGCGKTNLLLLRAKQLAGSSTPNIAVVVHTRTLQEFLRSGAPTYGISKKRITTFRKFATELLYRQGITLALPDDFEDSRETLNDALRDQLDRGSIKHEYDCVLVDEAQDFNPQEVNILSSAGKRFFAVADSRQQIYKGIDSVPALRKKLVTTELKFHYRNGRNICAVADGLAKDPVATPLMLPTSKYDEGSNPSAVEAIRKSDLSEQCAELIARLQTQLKAYPDELLGVACPRGEDLRQVQQGLLASPIADQTLVQTSEDGYVAFEGTKRICVCKLHSAKGLEFRAFHILAAEGLGKFPLQRQLAFMGVTRAKTSLTIYSSEDLPGYMQTALLRLAPPKGLLRVSELFDDDSGNEGDS